MIKAYPLFKNLGFFYLDGKTYSMRDRIKQLGGSWDGHHWVIPESIIESIPATKMYFVNVASHCHEPEMNAFATKVDVDRGLVNIGCSLCDSSNSEAKILGVIDLKTVSLDETHHKVEKKSNKILKTVGYYGSPLNKFVGDNLPHDIGIMNIDMVVHKWKDKNGKERLRYFESKHRKEKFSLSQEKMLHTKATKVVSLDSGLIYEVFAVVSNFPNDTKCNVMNIKTGEIKKDISAKMFLKFSHFDVEFDEL